MKQDENKIFFLQNAEILQAQSKEYRQYFIGNLKYPQILDYIEQNDLEVGTSLYQTPKADAPHMHRKSLDILYILSGAFQILLLEDRREYQLREGDFFAIPPQTPYASKSVQPNTRTLFIKTGGDDKLLVPIEPWLDKWLNT